MRDIMEQFNPENQVKEEEQEKKVPTGWEKNAVHTLKIEGYTADGAGVARLDGRVVFIPHTIRDEVWDVLLVKTNQNFAFGKGITCLTGSRARVEKDCHFRGKCGGCQYRHMNYEEELFAKHQQLENALVRIGGVNGTIPPIKGGEMLRYRNKVQFPVSGNDKKLKIGFYRPRSHDVLDVHDCLLQSEAAGIAREVLREWMTTFKVNAYDEKSGKGMVRHLFLRHNARGELLVCLVVTKEKVKNVQYLSEGLQQALPSLAGFVLNVNKKDTNVVLGTSYYTVWGVDFLYEEVCDLSFKLSVPSFFQVNLEQTKVLYDIVEDFANLNGTETVLDLYSGIGTISLMLAKKAGKVLGAEIVQEAVEDARANAERNGIRNVAFFQGDCGDVVRKFTAEEMTAEVIVVDPPRKGLAPEVPLQLTKLGAKRIVYVSCDPATLARDVKKLTEFGYKVKKVQGVDLFPRTKHVECVVLLERN